MPASPQGFIPELPSDSSIGSRTPRRPRPSRHEGFGSGLCQPPAECHSRPKGGCRASPKQAVNRPPRRPPQPSDDTVSPRTGAPSNLAARRHNDSSAATPTTFWSTASGTMPDHGGFPVCSRTAGEDPRPPFGARHPGSRHRGPHGFPRRRRRLAAWRLASAPERRGRRRGTTRPGGGFGRCGPTGEDRRRRTTTSGGDTNFKADGVHGRGLRVLGKVL